MDLFSYGNNVNLFVLKTIRLFFETWKNHEKKKNTKKIKNN